MTSRWSTFIQLLLSSSNKPWLPSLSLSATAESVSQLNKSDKIYVVTKEGKVKGLLEDKRIFNVSAVIAFTRGKEAIRARGVYKWKVTLARTSGMRESILQVEQLGKEYCPTALTPIKQFHLLLHVAYTVLPAAVQIEVIFVTIIQYI